MGRDAHGRYLGVQGLNTLPFLPREFRAGIFAHRGLDRVNTHRKAVMAR